MLTTQARPGIGLFPTTRIINTDSPYSVSIHETIIFCNTDGGSIAGNLPAGIEGKYYKIINTGSSGNDLTITPNGSEKVYAGSSVILSDGDVIDLHFNAIEGWW